MLHTIVLDNHVVNVLIHLKDPGKMDDVSNSSSTGAPPSIAQSVVSVMTGQNTIGRRNKRINSGMANPKKVYEEVAIYSMSHGCSYLLLVRGDF